MTVRLSRPASPASIEDDLAVLWREAGQLQIQTPPGVGIPVSRALMSNLVVYCRTSRGKGLEAAIPGAESADESTQGPEGSREERSGTSVPELNLPVEEVVQRHPARVIILDHHEQAGLCRPISAVISISLFGPVDARVGVEHILVRSPCAEASLPSIVRRLLLGDVPTSIWWAEDLSQVSPLDALLTMGRQLLYDSRGWADVGAALRTLAPIAADPDAPDLADLNWRRLAPLRLALAHALSAPVPEGVLRIRQVRVRHRPGERTLACLLAGWLAFRLQSAAAGAWPAEPAAWPIALEERPSEVDVVSVGIGTGEGTPDRARDDTDDITATLGDCQVAVRYRTGVAPFSMAVPQETAAEAIAAELRTLARDTTLCEAITAAREIIEITERRKEEGGGGGRRIKTSQG